MAVPKIIMKLAAKKAAKKLSGVLKTKSQKEKDTDLVQTMAASRVKLDDSLEEVDAKQNDAAEFLEDVRRLNPEKKSGATRTESPFYKMSKEEFGMLSVKAKQDDNPKITQADFVVNAEKKGLTRTVSPLEKYKCGYSSKRSSLRKSEGEEKVKNRKVIEDRGRGLGGITQDTTTNKFYSQTYPNVEMDSTQTRNPFDRSLITVNWSKKEK